LKFEWDKRKSLSWRLFMKNEYTSEDFAKAIKNPYIDKLCQRVELWVKNEDYDLFEKIAKENGVPVEAIFKRCISYYSKLLREDID